MVCNKCYYNNNDNSMFCTNCGELLEQNNSASGQNVNTQVNNNPNPQFQNNNTVNVPTYNMGNAIAALIVCFFCSTNIIGIVFAILSLVEGSKVSQFVIYGDMASANASLDQAKKWVKYAWISLAIWIALIVIFCVLYLVFVFGLAFMLEL